MSLATLIKVVPPPEPSEVDLNPNWDEIERVVGVPLPQDYKDYLAVYGTVSFYRFLDVFSPFSASAHYSLLTRPKEILDAYRVTWSQYPEYSPPFPPFPDPGGLLPWGATANGDTLCWLTVGDPDGWTVVVCDNKFTEEHDHFYLNMTGFLVAWLRREIEPTVFPDNVFTEGHPPVRAFQTGIRS